MQPTTAILGVYHRDMRSSSHKNPYMIVPSSFICSKPQSGNNQNVPQQMNGSASCGTSIPWNTIQQ